MKLLFATGAVLAAGTSLVRVSFGPDCVRVGGRDLTPATFQMVESEGNPVLASRDAVEPLGGLVSVQVGDRDVQLEPGVRLTRTASGFELSTHGRRRMVLTTEKGVIFVESPATLAAADGSWTVGGASLEGSSLRAALAQQIAAAPGTPGGGTDTPPPATPPGTGGTNHVSIRRVLYVDPRPSAEPTDEQTVKHLHDVSPSGLK